MEVLEIGPQKTHVQFDTEKNLLTLGCVEQVHVHVAFALACWT